MRLRARTAETSYEEHRGFVLGVLAQRCGWLDPSDREAAFHDAYTVLLEKQRAGELELERMHPRQIRAYLTLAAVRKAMDESKRAERRRTVPLSDGALEQPDPGASPAHRVAAEMDSAPVREIVAELPERQQAIVKLRFYFDRAPDEVQRFLDINERVYRRELERAVRQIAERYELVRAGRWCERRRSLVLAYVAGVAGPSRVREARAHLRSCPACAHMAADLRAAVRRVAAALPFPALDLDGGSLPRLSEVAAAARDAIADLGATGKQHAAQLVARVDPSSAHYAATVRPGSVAAALAGCVAAASGATYCVVSDVPDSLRSAITPLQRVVGKKSEREESSRQRAERRKRMPRARQAQAPVQPVAPPRPASTPAPRPTPAPAKPKRRRSAPRAGARGRDEFAFEATAPGGGAPEAPASSPRARASSPGSSPPPASPSPSKPRQASAPAPSKGAPGVFETGP